MDFNFSKEIDCAKARFRLENLIESKSKAEITKKQNTITSAQNRAMHKMFASVSDQLNEIGHTYKMVWGDEIIPLSFSGPLIKETLWRPIQISLFNIESTTKINTQQINQILDIVTAKFADIGIPIVWPNRIDYLIEQELKQR